MSELIIIPVSWIFWAACFWIVSMLVMLAAGLKHGSVSFGAGWDAAIKFIEAYPHKRM